jgi:multiple sugar transport system ATP-binding protein
MTQIELDQVSKRFGNVHAVKDTDLSIRDGEFVSIVGPSGCGKTTTLRVVAGLEEASSGSIFFGDEEVTTEPAAQRNVGMVFQNLALYPHMTVRENMEFGLKVTDVSEGDRERRITEAARMLDIEELLDRKPKQLSGGQQQRVAIGRTIVLDPEVFLLDEPLASLDAKLRVEIREELQELHNRIGVTTVYVTHDQEQAMTMSDRIVVMNDGEIQQFAPPEEVYDDPNNEFVAHFIGTPSMNFFDGEITTSNESIVVDCGFSQFDLNERPVESSPSSQAVRFGVRPEHVRLGDDGDFTAEVKFVEPTGKDKIVHLNAGSTELSAIVPGEQTIQQDREYGVTFDRDRVHLFDASTGAALD